MTALPNLPNELILLLFKHQTTISNLLTLSSLSRTTRSLFLANISSIFSKACKNTNVLCAAKPVVDTITEIARLPTHFCDCASEETDEYYHFHKNVSNQHYIADLVASFPAELRKLRSLSRVLNFAMMAADKAIEFWTARAKKCQANHGSLKIDREKLTQIYLLLWVCAESHFSVEHDSRAKNMVAMLPRPALTILWEVHDFSACDLDRPTKLLLGSTDPDEDDWSHSIMANYVALNHRGQREDASEDVNINLREWCMRESHLYPARKARREAWPLEQYDGWLSEKPEGCTCHDAVLIEWDLVQVHWWHIWNRTV